MFAKHEHLYGENKSGNLRDWRFYNSFLLVDILAIFEQNSFRSHC